MEKDKNKLDASRPDPVDVFPDSDPNLEDLKGLKVDPFTESDIFLDIKLRKKKTS
jgi:hypothetical protein